MNPSRRAMDADSGVIDPMPQNGGIALSSGTFGSSR